MNLPVLENFALVGETNLSLKLGHRLSVDLDILSNKGFEFVSIPDVVAVKLNDISKRVTKKIFMIWQIFLTYIQLKKCWHFLAKNTAMMR